MKECIVICLQFSQQNFDYWTILLNGGKQQDMYHLARCELHSISKDRLRLITELVPKPTLLLMCVFMPRKVEISRNVAK